METTKFEARLKELSGDSASPISVGEVKILQAYNRTKETTESDTLVIFDSFFPSELDEASLALLEFGVKSLIITCKSTSLMETLNHFISEGWKISGNAEVETTIGFESKSKGLLLSL